MKGISEEKTRNKMIGVKIHVSVILCKHFNAELRIKRKNISTLLNKADVEIDKIDS